MRVVQPVTNPSADIVRQFFDATCTLATHAGSLQARLADAYADHLLQVVVSDLPAELQAAFRDIEQRMAAAGSEGADDPFRAAAERLSDAEARTLIERIVVLFGRLAAISEFTAEH